MRLDCGARMLAVVAVCGLAGCGGGIPGPDYVPVSGVVTLDGRPVEGATVTFAPKTEGSMSIAMTDAAGRFKLKSATGRDGAAVGEHAISVNLSVTPELPGAAAPSADDLAPPTEGSGLGGGIAPPVEARTMWIVPEKYSSPETSGLSVTVPDDGLSEYALELKKN